MPLPVEFYMHGEVWTITAGPVQGAGCWRATADSDTGRHLNVEGEPNEARLTATLYQTGVTVKRMSIGATM